MSILETSDININSSELKFEIIKIVNVEPKEDSDNYNISGATIYIARCVSDPSVIVKVLIRAGDATSTYGLKKLFIEKYKNKKCALKSLACNLIKGDII